MIIENLIAFEVLGKPIAKGRPRLSRQGHAFTPTTTRNAEARFLRTARRHAPTDPWKGNVHIKIVFIFAHPKATPKAIKDEANYRRKKPDLDNLVKLVMDSMEPFFIDDAQVVSIESCKFEGPFATTQVQIWETQPAELKKPLSSHRDRV